DCYCFSEISRFSENNSFNFLPPYGSFAYSITWISMKQPSIGWLFLGCLIGGTSGFFQALKSIKQDDIFKIINLGRFITIALALLIIISGYVAIVVKTDICYIRKS
ncbi:MAG: hypothetical protein HC862_23570, partial [Scytonema sp. RU_4_4]|nr:hypothetical protein [Scytonema sp. RU_4_4]